MKTNYLFKLCVLLLPFAAFTQEFAIYVCDTGNFANPPWQILKYDQNGENPEVFIDDNLNWPQDILFLEDQGVVLISNLGSGKITKHDASTGAYIEDFANVAGGPTRIKIGPDGMLYVLQWGTTNNKVKRFDLDGTFVDDFTSVSVPRSIGLDWDSSGNLYVVSWNQATVSKFDPSGEFMNVFADSSELVGPTNIWVDAANDVYVIDWTAGVVHTYGPDGSYVGGIISGLSQPEGVAFYPDGRFLIGDGGTASVKLYGVDNTFIDDIVPSGLGGLIQPNAVVLRDTAFLSLNEVSSDKLFVTPTLGRSFTFNPAGISGFQSLTVYNSSGQLVEKLNLSGSLVLDAGKYSVGLYFIIGNKGGKTFSQKIMVKG